MSSQRAQRASGGKTHSNSPDTLTVCNIVSDGTVQYYRAS